MLCACTSFGALLTVSLILGIVELAVTPPLVPVPIITQRLHPHAHPLLDLLHQPPLPPREYPQMRLVGALMATPARALPSVTVAQQMVGVALLQPTVEPAVIQRSGPVGAALLAPSRQLLLLGPPPPLHLHSPLLFCSV